MIKTDDKSNEIKPMTYSLHGKSLTFNKPLIMAIINVTPDSFYDGGKYGETNDILRDIETKLHQGADIIDLGAASTRPGAPEISEEEEWHRLKSIIPIIRNSFKNTVISLDTYRSGIAKKGVEMGIDIINDVSGGTFDKNMFNTVIELDVPYILMHMDGTPQNMQNNAPYEDVVNAVKNKLKVSIDYLNKRGFKKLIIDPGFGFGKSLKNNYELLKSLHHLKELAYPILVGVSRKSMINKVIQTNPVTALNGTTVLHTIALLNGADILRLHDVAEAKQVIELVNYYQNV